MNNQYSKVILEYERVLLGQKKVFSSYYFNDLSEEMQERTALAVIKYAIETYLGWTPVQAKKCLNMHILRVLKLDTLLRYIHFWAELDAKKDLFFIVYLMYPKQIRIDRRKYILNVYKDVVEHRRQRFPKGFFDGIEGKNKASICFQYMLENYLNFTSKKQMYAFFASPKASSVLQQYRLSNVCSEIFITPIRFLHESLPKSLRDEYDYKYAQYYATPNSNLIVKKVV